jgi:hypothetical protein
LSIRVARTLYQKCDELNDLIMGISYILEYDVRCTTDRKRLHGDFTSKLKDILDLIFFRTIKLISLTHSRFSGQHDFKSFSNVNSLEIKQINITLAIA